MRILAIVIALSGAVITQPIYGQTPGPQLPQMTPPQGQAQSEDTPAGQGRPGLDFTGVAVVAVEDLPAEIKAQADAVINQTSAQDLLRLQKSIDASPQATSSLRTSMATAR